MNDEVRPSPEALLAAATREAAGVSRGRLRVFLGMCPGVGKTYSMLLAAQQRQEEGGGVLIGVVETHGRIETQALTAGIARVPLRQMEHRGVILEEMDVDAILSRHPSLVVVDELAHTNVPGSRHPKRYLDVLELLEAGIDVFTTLNVQHIESQRDVVAQFTGIIVHETIPDSLLDAADEIEVVDVSPEQLRKRLDEGKVYLGERARIASANFFREGNLKALREIALRLSADRADRDFRQFLQASRPIGSGGSRERLLVAIGPSPYSGRLIRWTRRMAAASHATWVAVFVDTGRTLNDQERDRLEQNLALSRSLGAEVFSLSGEDVVETLVHAARQHHVTQIVVGKPLTGRVFDFFQGGSLADKLIRRSGDIDVYVVRAEKDVRRWSPGPVEYDASRIFRECGIAVLAVFAVTVVGFLFRGAIGYMAVGLLYLLAVLLGSAFLSRWPTLLFGSLTALAWNYLFIQPYYTFYIRNPHDIILFVMYFVMALILGDLHARLRRRERAERRREQQAVALYNFTSDITRSHSLADALLSGIQRMNELFGVETSIIGKTHSADVSLAVGASLDEREMAVARWAMEHGQSAGRYTTTLPQAEGLYLPLLGSHGTVGVLGIRARSALLLGERQMVETFASQIALLMEREELRFEAEQSRIEDASRHLQKTLLDSVSHEFKTPVSVITTAVEYLQNLPGSSRPYVEEIRVAAARLARIVENLLDMTRIETGTVRSRLEWCDLHEIAGAALRHVQAEFPGRIVNMRFSSDLGAVLVDAGLLEEMLGNLLRNAMQYSSASGVVLLEGSRRDGTVCLKVLDEGSGLPEADVSRLFEKFQRGPAARAGGLGLGLSIVRGFAHAMGGSVTGRSRQDGRKGAEFEICLPLETRPVDSLIT